MNYKDFRKDQNRFASAWFVKNYFPVQSKYPYILKGNSDWKNNIILSNVAEFVDHEKAEYEKKKVPFPIHKYIHHGLSSQAMLFNLLGDSVDRKDVSFFSDLFNFQDISIQSDSELLFEYSDRKIFNENQQQPTSFDFAVINKTGKNIFLEAKYVETSFGRCSITDSGECDGLNPGANNELCYLKQKGRTYWELMEKYGLNDAFKHSPICPFTIFYQFYRELMFALENNGYYVILTDDRNPAFLKSTFNGKRGWIPVLLNMVPANLIPFIKTITIQEVIDKLEKQNYGWTNIFREKYGIN